MICNSLQSMLICPHRQNYICNYWITSWQNVLFLSSDGDNFDLIFKYGSRCITSILVSIVSESHNNQVLHNLLWIILEHHFSCDPVGINCFIYFNQSYNYMIHRWNYLTWFSLIIWMVNIGGTKQLRMKRSWLIHK